MAGAATGHTEIETKLEVPATGWETVPDPTTDPVVRATGVVTAQAAPPVELDARYYDTDALDLLASHVTLRRRTGGGDAGWHLKLPAPTVEGAPSSRREHHVPLEPDGTARSARTVPPQLLSVVRGTARGRWIAPVARLTTTRTVVTLSGEDGIPLLEIADDHVVAQRLGDTDEVRWREVEVELLQGTLDQLIAVVDHLVARGATVSDRPSKVGTVLTAPTSSPATVAGRLLAHCRDRLVEVDRALRLDVTGAAPGAATAVRTARSVLDLVGAADRPSTRALTAWDDLVAAERAVQVTRALLIGELTDTHARHADRARSVVELELSRRERRVADDLTALLAGEEHLRLLQDWDDLVEAADTSSPGAELLEERLDAIWNDLRDAVDAALGDPEFAPAVGDAVRVALLSRDCLVALLPEFLPDAQLDAEDAVTALDTVIRALEVHRDAGRAAAFTAELAEDDMVDGATGFLLGRLFAAMTTLQTAALEDFGDVWDELGEAELPIIVQG